MAHGIDPNKAIELTRFYTLPGSPTNAISIIDKLVAEYYKNLGIEAIFTTTMPMYSKTKSSTIAGGMNKVLLVKSLRHTFVQEVVHCRQVYRHVVGSLPLPVTNIEGFTISTHSNFPTMQVVEVFKLINEPSLPPLPELAEGSKAIYIKNRKTDNQGVEREAKFKMTDINDMLVKLEFLATYRKTMYIRDIIFGNSEIKGKARLRIENDVKSVHVEISRSYIMDMGSDTPLWVKVESEELLYLGSSIVEAREILEKLGYKEENSYEKMRVSFEATDGAHFDLDVYPFGSWLEIEGTNEMITDYMGKLGLTESDTLVGSADDVYLAWIKKNSLPEQWDVRFGLFGK